MKASWKCPAIESNCPSMDPGLPQFWKFHRKVNNQARWRLTEARNFLNWITKQQRGAQNSQSVHFQGLDYFQQRTSVTAGTQFAILESVPKLFFVNSSCGGHWTWIEKTLLYCKGFGLQRRLCTVHSKNWAGLCTKVAQYTNVIYPIPIPVSIAIFLRTS